jgi:hypothetical protein
MNLSRRSRVLILIAAFACVAVVFTYLGSELRRTSFGAAPLDTTVAYSVHPRNYKSAHVYVVPIEGGVSVRMFVYEGGPDWILHGHPIGEIATVPDFDTAVRQFGVITWSDAGLAVGAGGPTDRIVLSKADVDNLR